MFESIERTDLEEEVEVSEIKQRKKRVLSDKQKEAVAKNLEKGRLKLQEKNLQKQAKRGEELQEKVLKKEVSSVKSKSAEDRRVDLALKALEMVRDNSNNNIESGNDDEPKPRKKSIKKLPEPDTETEVEEIIVKKSRPKKKTVIYMNDTETDTDIEPVVKPKRSYRKRVEDKKEQEPISAPTPQPQIIFY